jgi:glycosyltransferase involved in cell wall biosynthesis
LIFNLSDPLWTPYFRERGGWADIDKILSAVDAIVCTTSYAREYALKFGKLTIVVPEYANLDLFDSMRGTVGKVLGKIRLGWVGGETTTRAICKIEAVLEQLARAYPAVELRLVGVGPNGMLPTFRYLRYTTRPAGYSEEEMARELLGMDVGLFPPPLDLYNYEVRGPLKALNYMAAAVPCVCQNAGVLREIIVDGVNGMLAGGLDEWKEKIEALLRDASLRRRMGEAGLATVRAHFAPEDIRSLFVNEVEQACEVIDLPHPVTRIPYRLTTRLDWARLALGGWTLSMLRRIRILTRIRSWLRRHPTAG